MFGKFFHSRHHSMIIFVGQIVEFVNFYFWNDESVARGFGVNIEEGEGTIVFVDFITRDFALDDFGENSTHSNIITDVDMMERLTKCGMCARMGETGVIFGGTLRFYLFKFDDTLG